jgi:hypothetical protein
MTMIQRIGKDYRMLREKGSGRRLALLLVSVGVLLAECRRLLGKPLTVSIE